jgi:phage gp37-like protein
LRTLATYGGELDEGLGESVRQFPAVWVAFKGEGEGQPVNTARSVYRVPATWVVFVAARNLRNEAATRKGDRVRVGTYQMLADVRALLAGQDLGLEMDALLPGRVQSMVNARLQGQGVSVYAMEWHTKYDYRAFERGTGQPTAGADGQPTAPLPVLSRIGVNYYLTPGDDVADAVDLLTLQEGRAAADTAAGK